jgi:trans-2,3-dihydro-3-hydroxyanthranilate isomerase
MYMSLRTFNFLQLDVFTAKPFEGNPLAVFPDATGLNDDQMQAIAREMNLSETTFILPRAQAIEKERGVRVRIFTVQEELPFAGHPTLGTAFALRGKTGANEIRLELNVGTVPVRFEDPSGEPAFGEMTQIEPTFGIIHDRAKIAEVTGIPIDDIAPDVPVQTISTGVPFTVLPLRDLAAARRLRIDQTRSTE